jgi:WD40 repeat protein
MTEQEALKIVARLLEQHQRGSLTTLQAEIVSKVWNRDSYQEMGRQLGYEPEYIKQVASHLWRLLSQLIGEKVSKSNLGAILQRYRTCLTTINWGEAIDVSHFYGRATELKTLEQWIVDSRCRVVGIFGWGGIGKTALSVKLAQQLEAQFECVVWRSLRQAIAPQDLLNEILPILIGAEVQESSISLLMQQLRQKRCLLVFDNVESILQAGSQNGCYLAGYAAYGEIFQRVSDENHQSCMVITSREKPSGMSLREGVNLPVRSLQLTGLEMTAAQHLLIDKGIAAPLIEQHNLINYVYGHPLALKLVATSIQNLFNGDISAFLAQGTAVFGNLWELLDRQFDRLSALQQQVMYWLAIDREGVTPARLQSELIPVVTLPILLAALETLRDRSLIETTESGLTQQPVIMEYVTERFIGQIEREIITGELELFRTHALIEAQTKDYLRDAQIQLILQPLVDRLSTHFTTRTDLEQHLCQILATFHHQPAATVGYAVGNLLNLFIHLKTDLQGYDFSHLAIRQAYLVDAILHNVNFTGSQISQTAFAEIFGAVIGIAYSPDGKLLATGDTNGGLQVWNTRSMDRPITCSGHGHWTYGVDFSPDGQYLVSAGEDLLVKLWDVATGKCLYTYEGHTGCISSVFFSPDGTIVASCGKDATIRLWQVLPQQLDPQIWILKGHEDRVWCIAFSPDGRMLVSGGQDRSVRLWDVATGVCLAEWLAHSDWVKFVAFSPDGRSIATSSYDRTIKLWDIATQKCLQTLTGHKLPVSAVAFSPDGQQLVSSSFDRTIKLWDTSTGKCSNTLLGHRSRIWMVAFHPNGRLIASGGDDHTTKLWDLKLGRCIKTLVGHTNAVLSVALSPDGCYLASGFEDKTIKVWEIENARVTHTLVGHDNRVWSAKFSPNGRLIASASSDYSIKLWDWQTQTCLQTLDGHNGWIWAVVFHPKDRILASSSYDQTVKLWDIDTGQCLKTLRGHTSPVVAVDFSPNGRLLVSSAYNGTIKLWDLDSDKSYEHRQGYIDTIRSVKFSNNGKWFVSASDDKTIELWSALSGECLQTFCGHQGGVYAARFCPDDRLIISAGRDYNLKIWDIQTGKCLHTLTGHSGLIYDLEVGIVRLPAAESAAVPATRPVVLEFPRGALLGKTPRPHSLPVEYLAKTMYSPKFVAFTSSLDETIKVWDLEAAKCLATWKSRRPYEGMQIDKIHGLTKAQQATLQALGAVR